MKSSEHKPGFSAFVTGLLPLFLLAHFVHHLLTALPTPLLPMIRSDFSLDYTLSGLVISAFNISYGIGQLPGGWLADRLRPRIIITVGVCGAALAGFLIGFSQSFWMMIILLAFMGVLGGGYHPAAPAMISAAVAREHQGRALGLHMIGGGASFFLAPLIAVGIASYWGWRGSFITLSAITLLFGIIFYIVLGRIVVGKQVERKFAKRSSDPSAVPGRLRHLIIFIFMSTISGAVLFSAMSFIPLYLVDKVGFSQETAGAFYAFIYSAGLWVSPLGGYLSDRLGAVPVVLFVLFLAGPVIYLLNFVSSWLSTGILLLLIGTIIYVRMPVSEAYIVARTSEQNRSTILGIYFFGHMEGIGVLAPVMGYLIDRLGFYNSFTIAGGILVVVPLIGSLLLRGSRA